MSPIKNPQQCLLLTCSRHLMPLALRKSLTAQSCTLFRPRINQRVDDHSSSQAWIARHIWSTWEKTWRLSKSTKLSNKNSATYWWNSWIAEPHPWPKLERMLLQPITSSSEASWLPNLITSPIALSFRYALNKNLLSILASLQRLNRRTFPEILSPLRHKIEINKAT